MAVRLPSSTRLSVVTQFTSTRAVSNRRSPKKTLVGSARLARFNTPISKALGISIFCAAMKRTNPRGVQHHVKLPSCGSSPRASFLEYGTMFGARRKFSVGSSTLCRFPRLVFVGIQATIAREFGIERKENNDCAKQHEQFSTCMFLGQQGERVMEEPNIKRRHWFRFSLRTMFALLTILGLFLGLLAIQIKWIHDRHEALVWMLPLRARQLAMESGHALPPQKGKYVTGRKPPWILGIFGESGIERIEVYQDWLVADARYSLIGFNHFFPKRQSASPVGATIRRPTVA